MEFHFKKTAFQYEYNYLIIFIFDLKFHFGKFLNFIITDLRKTKKHAETGEITGNVPRQEE